MILSTRDLQDGVSRRFSGETDSAGIGLGEANAEAAGAIAYDFEAGISDGGIWVRGIVRVPVRLTCVGCLEKFQMLVEVPEFAVQIPLEGRERIDLTESLREDIFLALPPYPKCDLEEGKTCPANFPRIDPVPGEEANSGPATAWDALDKLKSENEESTNN